MENLSIVKANGEQSSLAITSVSDLEMYSKGSVVKLPDFAEGFPFVARLRRPSLLSLVGNGKIPNQLLVAANEIFQEGLGGYDPSKENSLKDVFSVIDTILEASLIEPTYQDIKNSGMELTDDQRLAIFNYSQQGVEGLASFR